MKINCSVLALALLATETSAALIVGRSGATITAAINNIKQQLITLDNSVRSFQGGAAGTGQALVIQGQTVQLSNAIQSATSTASSSNSLSDSESSQVAYAIDGLQLNIYQTLNDLVAKKNAFNTAILGVGSAGSLVYSDLITLKNNTDAFGSAVTPKLVATLTKVAPLLTANIDFHFDQAINAYKPT